MVRVRSRAFSLIELIVSISVISMLCAIVVPSWRDYYRRMELVSSAHQIAGYIQEAQQWARNQQPHWYVPGNNEEGLNFIAKNNGKGKIEVVARACFWYNPNGDGTIWEVEPSRFDPRKNYQPYIVGNGNVYISNKETSFSKTGKVVAMFDPVGAAYSDTFMGSGIEDERNFYLISPGYGTISISVMKNGKVIVGSGVKYW